MEVAAKKIAVSRPPRLLRAAGALVALLTLPALLVRALPLADALVLGVLAAYVLLLAATAHQIDRYWRRAARDAIYEERLRLAEALHGGLAQELAFIVAQGQRLVAGSEPSPAAQQMLAAARRALDESRRTMTSLRRPVDEGELP